MTRSQSRSRTVPFAALLISILLTACQSGGPAPSRVESGDAPAAPRTVKTLVIGSGREHVDVNTFGGGEQDAEVTDLVNAGLFRQNALTANADPWMVEAAPSPDRGTWVVNADGTITTWAPSAARRR